MYTVNGLFPETAKKFAKEVADFNIHNELCVLEETTGIAWDINDETKTLTPVK